MRALRLEDGAPVYYRAVALTYLGGGHYICDVNLADIDDPCTPSCWRRYDHCNSTAQTQMGVGSALAPADLRRDDRIVYLRRGKYRLSTVLYLKVAAPDDGGPTQAAETEPVAETALAGGPATHQFVHAATLHGALRPVGSWPVDSWPVPS